MRRLLLALACLLVPLLATTAPASARPIRAMFYYPWFPETWGHGSSPYTRYHPSLGLYRSADPATLRTHLRAMRYAGMDAVIVSWFGPNTRSHSRLVQMMRTARRMHSPLRFAVYYEMEARGNPNPAALRRDLARIALRTRAKNYLRIGGRPVVFVWSEGDGCGSATRWREAAGRRFYVVQKIFRGYERCQDVADAWHQYAPAQRATSAGADAFSISPGFFHVRERRARLARDLAAFKAAVRDMVASGARFQLVTTFNEWGEGTAVESAEEWRSRSRHGAYLDVLHRALVTARTRTIESFALVARQRIVSLAPIRRRGRTAAVVRGSIARSGARGRYWLVYGSGAKTFKSRERTIGPGSGRLRVSFRLRHLAPGTRYFARLVLERAGHTRRSTLRRFRTRAPLGGAPLIAAAGDIVCDPADATPATPRSCEDGATAALIGSGGYSAVLPLGDLQYERGAGSLFQSAYDGSWGAYRSITYPAVGNHEYLTRDAAGYFDYFGAAAGGRDKGYYSYDIGSWHLIAINSNCSHAGGCQAGSPQERWLRADLAANPAKCTLAYWHHPRYSSGQHGDTTAMKPIWQALLDGKADVVLSGHDHNYERFAPQDNTGHVSARGIRQFVVGTGGKSIRAPNRSRPGTSEVADGTRFGILRLRLKPAGYDWTFVPTVDGGFTDGGSSDCV